MNKIFIPLIFLFFVSLSCDIEMEDYFLNDMTLYSNSFENSGDTTGWKINAAVLFKDDAPDNCGKRSLYVSGGCLVPHAYVDLDPVNKGYYLRLQCWGKMLQNGGSVYLEIPDDRSQNVNIQVKDSVWTYYKSENVLTVPAGKKVRVGINAGGYIPGSILVDKLEVVIIP
jgi:hypothetical protein